MDDDKVTKQNRHHALRYDGNFWYLFAGLLLTLLVLPFTSRLLIGGGRYSLTLLFSLFMLVAIWSLDASRRVFQFGALLILCISSVAAVSAFGDGSRGLELTGLLLVLVFCTLSCYIAARHVFVIHQVDLNSLVGAFCVYLLLGLIWALLYHLLSLYGVVAFTGNITSQDENMFPDLVYFSFVTLASLGYGDIAPVGALPRTLAYLEAVTGQFYLAVMVASLVGVYSARRKER